MFTSTQDRALRSLASASIQRRQLLRGLGIGIASVAVGGRLSLISAQDTSENDAPFETPVDVLNYALTLEHLEAAFYRDGLAEIGEAGITGLGFQSSVFTNLSAIAGHEADHVETLQSVIGQLGGEPVAEAMYDFGYTDAAGFIQMAQVLEDTGVQAYQGAARYAMADDDLLTAALTIHGVEARHASYLALLIGGNPFPEAFNPTLTPEEVLEIASPLIVG